MRALLAALLATTALPALADIIPATSKITAARERVVRDESGRGTMRLRNRPETLPVSLTFMPLFRNM